MIQFNLLPDVKLQYLKARRTRRLVTSASTVAIIAALAVLVLLLGTVYVFQKKNLSDLNRDIKNYSSQLEGTPDLNKILTVQNQLNVLTSLHDQKPVASRLFGYLTQLTPTDATISKLDVDYTQNTMSITGSAKALDVVNTYADTLKFTTYTKDGSNASTNAFTNVVLSQFSRNSQGASYTITANFDPVIFNNANTVKLTVPNIISTRSAVEQPSDLFKTDTSTSPGGQ
jgi:uncharacterized membrane protein YciS (DUF1049 family)